MKISIDRIKKEGKVYVDYEDVQFENRNERESTKGPLDVNLVLSLVGNENIKLKGEVKGKFILICDRCCDSFEVIKRIEIDEISELEKKELVERMIDLTPRIRDIVLSSFPIKILCREDCKGICLGCKVNLNKEKCRCK